MRRNIIRISLVVLVIIIAVFLYNIGKSHKIYFDNKNITIGDTTYTASNTCRVWVDDEESQDVRNRSRKVFKVAGAAHTIVVQEVVNGELSGERIEKKIKFKLDEGAIVNLPVLLDGAESWYEINTEI